MPLNQRIVFKTNLKTMKTKIILLIMIFGILLFTNCGKKGCTDKTATNYCSSCKKDDGTCTFQAKVIFWQKQANASSWGALGVTSLKFYVDGALIGSSAPTIYFSSSPSCSSTGLASVTKDLGSSKSKSFSYSVKDQTNFEWYSGTINLDVANSCTTQELN